MAAVRAMRALDLDAVIALQRRAGRVASDGLRADLERGVDDPRRRLIVAEVGDELVGWAATSRREARDGLAPAEHWLTGMAVDPVHRRRGNGHALVDDRMRWISLRADRASFVVNAANAASIAAHARWPFREVARGPRLAGVDFDGEGLLLVADLHAVGAGPRC